MHLNSDLLRWSAPPAGGGPAPRGRPADPGGSADELCAPLPQWGEAPEGNGFVGLLHAFFDSGGTLEAEAVDRLLQACQGAEAGGLSGLLETRQVFGFEWRDALWIPMFQFNPDDLSVRPGSQRVRDELPVLWSGWNQACWFASPNIWLSGRAPVELFESAQQDLEEAARAWRPPHPSGPEGARAPGSVRQGFS